MRGHIRERSPGRWAIVIDARDPQTGKRKRRWHSFAGTKREAQTKCAQLIAEAQGVGAIEPSKIMLAQFLDRFDRDWIATHVSARSAERYRSALAHMRRHLGDRLLQKLAPADLAALYATLHRAGLAPRTVKLVHVVLHRALGQAKVWGIIRDNPAETAKPPKAPQRETDMLQPKEAARLLDRLRGKPLYLLASLGLATGMRRNEMLALRWRDLDLDHARLTVAQALEQTKTHGIRVKGPKSKHGKRVVSLPAHVVTELRQHWREQQEQRLALGLGRAADDAPVFATYDGKFMSPDALSHAWMRQMESLGMSDVTLHSLRHTHASVLLRGGVDVVTVSRRLGHGSPRVTLEVYGHLIDGADDRAAAIMDAAFGGEKR
jgi:integrase